MASIKKIGQLLIYDVTRFCSRMVAIVFYRAKWNGQENIPMEAGGLICANHQSYFDPVLIGITTRRRLNYLARESLFRGPFGWLIRCLNAIPIQRDGMGIAGFKATLKRLRQQEVILIFPEGTRSEDGQVQELKSGFCSLARRGNVPLIPAGIFGAYDAWPRNRRFPKMSKIGIVYGPPIQEEEIANLTDEQLIERLQAEIVRCFEAAQKIHQN